MNRRAALPLCCVLAVALFWVCAASAQEYVLKDYMPQGIGSKWTMKSTGGRGEETLTVEVTERVDINGAQVPMTVTKGADGRVRTGIADLASPDKYTVYGQLFGGRPGAGGAPAEPTRMDYNPPAEFPGKLTVGQTAEAAYKTKFGDREADVTMKIELAGLENVIVPKGTFDNCLKLVITTKFGDREMKRTVWLAKGVGAVKTERPGFGDRPPTVTELVDYTLVTE
jgi:hypothetical protein